MRSVTVSCFSLTGVPSQDADDPVLTFQSLRSLCADPRCVAHLAGVAAAGLSHPKHVSIASPLRPLLQRQELQEQWESVARETTDASVSFLERGLHARSCGLLLDAVSMQGSTANRLTVDDGRNCDCGLSPDGSAAASLRTRVCPGVCICLLRVGDKNTLLVAGRLVWLRYALFSYW